MKNLAPIDAAALEAVETREWLESLDYVIAQGDKGRVVRLLDALAGPGAASAVSACRSRRRRPTSTRFAPHEQVAMPGDGALERRIKSLVRWNALAMVVRANRESDGIGGHISTYASAATLYEVGFNHFFRGKDGRRRRRRRLLPGARVARASMRGRFSRAGSPKSTCELPARAAADGGGLSSYPHPWLMPDFWEYPTVSMGIGPLTSIYQARFIKYLQNRGLKTPVRAEGLGVSRRRRDGRAGDARGDLARGARAARQPDLRHQLQPAAARRSRARQRPDHPGTRVGVPRRRLERHQVHLGIGVGRPARARLRGPARQAAWARSSTANTSATSPKTAPTCASTSGAPIPRLLEMVRHLSDDELKKLRPGRPRPA